MSLSLSQVAAMSQGYVFFPLDHFLDAVAGEGLTAVELWGGAPHICIEDWGPRTRVACGGSSNGAT